MNECADTRLVCMNDDEHAHMLAMLDNPTDDFTRLVAALETDGCTFARQQAALMLRNTPGVARRIIEDHA